MILRKPKTKAKTKRTRPTSKIPPKGEVLLARLLDFAGHEYRTQYRFHPKRNWAADFYLPAGRLIVEVDGISYRGSGGRHQTGTGFSNDIEKLNSAATMGFAVLRFTPAMVQGNARSDRAGRPYYPAAIDVIDEFILGADYLSIDRSKPGYGKTRKVD